MRLVATGERRHVVAREPTKTLARKSLDERKVSKETAFIESSSSPSRAAPEKQY